MSLRLIFILVFVAGLICTFAGLAGLFSMKAPAAKLLNSAAALLGLASVLQLKLSGWFDAVLAEYADVEKYPYGPPSAITRQIIDNPDAPIQTAIRNFLFFDAETGFKLGVVSLAVALIAAWA